MQRGPGHKRAVPRTCTFRCSSRIGDWRLPWLFLPFTGHDDESAAGNGFIKLIKMMIRADHLCPRSWSDSRRWAT